MTASARRRALVGPVLCSAALACSQVQDFAGSSLEGGAWPSEASTRDAATSDGAPRDAATTDATDATDATLDAGANDAEGPNVLPPFDDGNGLCGLPWSTGGGTFITSTTAPPGLTASCVVCPTVVGTPAILATAMPYPMPEAGSFVLASVQVRAAADAGDPADASSYALAAVTPRTGDVPGTATPASAAWLPATETWAVPSDAGPSFLYKVFVFNRRAGDCLLLADPRLLVGR